MIFVLVCFLLIVVALSALTSHSRLSAAKAVCMICTAILGGGRYMLGSYSLNLGVIFFTVLMFAFTLTYHINGRVASKRAIYNLLEMLFIVFGIVAILECVAPMEGGFFHISRSHVEAVFLTTGVGLPALFLFLSIPNTLLPMIRLPLCMVGAEIVLSFVFVVLKYHNSTMALHEVIQLALVEGLIKLTITALSLPLLIMVIKTNRRDTKAAFLEAIH
jgi:hypothetical protein